MIARKKTKQLDLFDAASDDPKKIKANPIPRSVSNVSIVERYLSDHQVAERLGISRASVWRWLKNDPDFPRRIRMSPGTSRWKLSDLMEFEAKRQADSAPPLAKRRTQ